MLPGTVLGLPTLIDWGVEGYVTYGEFPHVPLNREHMDNCNKLCQVPTFFFVIVDHPCQIFLPPFCQLFQ